MSEPIKQPTAPGDPASGVQGGGEALSSKQPASNADEDAEWAALVRWREGVKPPLRARIAELERERSKARNLVQTWQELAEEVEVERDRAKVRIAALECEWDEAQARCREAAQALIAAIDASGPENVEDTARRAAQHVAELERARDAVDRCRRNAALAIDIATAAMDEALTKREAAEARIRELERLVALGKEADRG